jgi:hypothetical protein
LGSGASCDNATSPYRPADFSGRPASGFLAFGTGTTSSGAAGFDSNSAVGQHRFDTGNTFYETLVYIPTLSDGTDSYAFRTGYTQGYQLTSNNLAIEYSSTNTVPGNWHGICQTNSGTVERTDLGVAVEAAKWIRLRISVQGASVVSFQVNDITPRVAQSASIRSDGAYLMGTHIVKTAGTANRFAVVDYVYYRHDFDQERTYT